MSLKAGGQAGKALLHIAKLRGCNDSNAIIRHYYRFRLLWAVLSCGMGWAHCRFRHWGYTDDETNETWNKGYKMQPDCVNSGKRHIRLNLAVRELGQNDVPMGKSLITRIIMIMIINTNEYKWKIKMYTNVTCTCKTKCAWGNIASNRQSSSLME